MPTQEYHASHFDLPAAGNRDVRKNDRQHSNTTDNHAVEIVQDLLGQRFSCRYFMQDKIPSDDVVKEILLTARNAPSGSNFQPWKVHILRGQKKQEVSKHVHQAHSQHADEYQAPYTFYPHNSKLQLPEYEHLAKRRANFGKQFYAPLQIDRKDVEARKHITARNWTFFDAPIGFVITTIADAPQGAYLDVGFFVMSLIIAIRSHGLECCVQEAHATFHEVYADHLHVSKNESVVCGLAVGYADMEKVVKFSGKQEKMTLEELAVFHD